MIYDALQQLTAEYGNFAYFCVFDHESRSSGSEKLFLSQSDPIFYQCNGDTESVFNGIDFALRNSGSEEIPAFFTFDFVNCIYPDLNIRRSGWPAFAYMIPEKVMESTVERKIHPVKRSRRKEERDERMEKIVSYMKDRIRSGDLLQVVISKEFPLRPFDKFELIREFIENDSSLYVYYYRFGKYEIIGSSPENMVSMYGENLFINPIAGTRPRGLTEMEDRKLSEELSTDEKDLLEHRMLVDLARNDLGKISVPGTVKVTVDMSVQKFSSVQHLVSTVVSKKKPEIKVSDIIRAVFPAGTVSGAPKMRALSLIDRYELKPRGAYSGCLGTIKKNGLDMALIIRSVTGINGSYSTRAGAGIVKDSDPEAECAEMISKAMTVIGGIKNESPGN